MTMKALLTILAVAVCCLSQAGCASKNERPVSTATGIIAPSSAGMTRAQLQATFMKAVPSHARAEPSRK